MSRQSQSPAALPPPPATIHLIGIGGVGMSGLARILVARGYVVTGSDAAESPIVDGLRAEGFAVTIGHDADRLGSPDLVVMTAAARETNPEVMAARARDIPVIKRAALLGLLCDERVCLAVAGTHGKSTTSGMLALALTRAGQDPSFAVGAIVKDLGTNARPGAGPIFVAEADEYDYSFLTLHPDVAVITNIEYDHPDLFPDTAAVDAAFRRFTDGIRDGGALVVSADDPGCTRLLAALDRPPFRVVTFGLDPRADWRIEPAAPDASGTVVCGPGGLELHLHLGVPGRHNRLNATAALAAGVAAGVDPASLLPGLEMFAGVGRRFETRGVVAGVTVIDEYSHHPTELRASLTAARERYPGARLWAVFQPHTYTRTKSLLAGFAEALSAADRVVLAPIYPARETDDLGVSSASIAARIVRTPVEVAGSPVEAGRLVARQVAPGDIVLVLGAGDIWKAGDALLEELG